MFFRFVLVFAALILLSAGISAARAADLPLTSPHARAWQPHADDGVLQRLRPRKLIRASTPSQSGCSLGFGFFCCTSYLPTGAACSCGSEGTGVAFNGTYCQ
jgi:hypothetical protein